MEIKCEIKEIKENHTLAVRTRASVEENLKLFNTKPFATNYVTKGNLQ